MTSLPTGPLTLDGINKALRDIISTLNTKGTGNGNGTVVGSGSVADGHLAVFDGTTGQIIKDGGAVPTAGMTDANGSISGIATGVTVVETGGAVLHKTVFTFTNVSVVLANDPGNGAFGGVKIYTLPKGILNWGFTSSIVATQSAAGVSATWSGSSNFGNATATDLTSFTAASNLQDPLTLGPAVAGSQNIKGGYKTAGFPAAQSSMYATDFSTTSGNASSVYFIFQVAAADETVNITPTNLILNGTVTMLWANNGDF